MFSIGSLWPRYFATTGENSSALLVSVVRIKTKWYLTMRSTHLLTRFSLIAVAAASVAASPVMANDDIIFAAGTGETVADGSAPLAAPDAQSEMLAMADRLSDPDLQDGIAHMAERMGETMMRLPIGKFASAIEKARPGTVRKRVREDATLADLAGRDARNIPALIGRESRTAMKMMSGFTKAFAGMMPEFEKLGREMAVTMADLKTKSR